MILRGQTMFDPCLGDADRVCFANRSIPALQDKTQVYPTDKIKTIPQFSVDAQTSPTPAPLFFSGRAGNACTNLLGFFVRYVRTRGIAEIAESGKTADFHFILCRTHLPRMARATNSCTREEIYKRGERSL